MAKGCSQNHLAERLEVSRQSVSKWETDASVPDLKKLMKLSELFEVTLDQLVRGEEQQVPEQEAEERAECLPADAPLSWRKARTVPALVLLGIGCVLLVFLLLLGGSWMAPMVAFPFLVSALIAVTCRRHPVLWSVWAFHFGVGSLFYFSTTIRWTLVLDTFHFDSSNNYTRLALAWVLVVVRVALFLVTVQILRREGKRPSQRTLILCGVAVMVLILIPDPFWYLLRKWDPVREMWFLKDGWAYFYRMLSYLVTWLRLFGCTRCIAISTRRVQDHKE